MPDPYITELELENLPLDSLQLKLNALRVKLLSQKSEFDKRKNVVLREIQIPVEWYLRNCDPDQKIKDSLLFMQAALKEAESITTLDARLTLWTNTLKIEEGENGDKTWSLASRLADLHLRLCNTGYLPRIYLTQVRPKILEEFTKIRAIFSKEANGLVTSHTREQTDILDLLKQSLSAATSEKDAESAVLKAILDVEQLIYERKNKLSLPVYRSRLHLGLETNEILLENLKKFKITLDEKSCLVQPFTFVSDFVGLRDAIHIIETRIHDREKSFEKRIEETITVNRDAFNFVKNVKLYLPDPVRDYLTLQEQLVEKIPEQVDLTDEQTSNLTLTWIFIQIIMVSILTQVTVQPS